LTEALDGIRAAGLNRVDLGTLPGFCPHFDFTHASAADERDFVAAVRDSGLTVHTFTTHIGHVNDPAVDPVAAMYAGLRNVRVAAELGAVGISYNCGVYRDRKEFPFEADAARMARHLHFFARECEAAGLRAMVEAPHKGNLVRTPAEAVRLRELTAHPNLQLILDINHHHAAGVTPAEAVAAIGAAEVGIVHLRDAVGRDNRFPLGAGDIDFKALFQALEAGGYPGCYSFEFTDASPTFDGNVDMLRRSIAYLESL
jgi:sugar phosphate isomerase/epimerase